MNRPECFTTNRYDEIKDYCNLPKYLTPLWKEKLGWMYDFPWRTEQLTILKDFQKNEWDTFVIQAIFGGGKTTMILAMIFDLIMQKKTTADRILVSAFNVAIKNEIKKKLKYAGKIVPRTIDSVVWHICNEMNYPHIKDPDFQEKRAFLYQNIAKIPPDLSIEYIFLDEAQDLERQIQSIFEKRFPLAKFVIVGDIFQSIQKEPRESFLWTLLQQKKRFTYNMTNSPRVPTNILGEMKHALQAHYPEFKTSISNWSSSNPSTKDNGISWNSFSTYGDVFQEMDQFVRTHGPKNSMILVFSSAITVRGTLGDVSRVRRFFSQKNIPLNANHKQMKDDVLFVSTVNSSKGLERDHVFCFLTFPLELAFSNFSSDILMNLVTVGLSRCKKSICFHVPKFTDRFSPLLHSYRLCPPPLEHNRKEKSFEEKKQYLHEDYFHFKPYLLQKDHSVTEMIRLQILSYSLQKKLIQKTKKYSETMIPPTSIRVSTEEESTIVGLLFETLILSHWTGKWPFDLNNIGMIGHSMYETFTSAVHSIHREWLQYQRNHPYSQCSTSQKVQGALLYSRVHLAYYQKIICSLGAQSCRNIGFRWEQLRPFVSSLHPKNIKTQDKAHYKFMNGIIDMSCQESENDLLEIVEIKASRQKDWNTAALIQAILYGLLKHKAIFKIHLINVLSKSWKHYYVSFQNTMKPMLKEITDEIQIYNLNCFLCKNRSLDNPDRKNFHFEHIFFMDGRYTIDTGWQELVFFEFTSPTKVSMIRHFIDKKDIDLFWEKDFKSFTIDFKIKKIIVSRFLSNICIPSVDFNFCFLNPKSKQISNEDWNGFLDSCSWTIQQKELPEELNNTKLNWKDTFSSTTVQIADLCTFYNFVN